MPGSKNSIHLTTSFDFRGILLNDNLPDEEHTLKGRYYAQLIYQLNETVKNRRLRNTRKFLLIDNSKIHFSKVAQEAIKKCGFTLVKQPAYSPDLNGADDFLWGDLKNELKGTLFKTKEEVFHAVEQHFRAKERETGYFQRNKGLYNDAANILILIMVIIIHIDCFCYLALNKGVFVRR